MYNPTPFQEDRAPALVALIRDHPLATVVRHSAEGLSADHVPLLYKPNDNGLGTLIGHVAKNNPLWQVSNNEELLLVFQGASTYISPNWYATKAVHHKVVPTWNYAVVHAHCTLQAVQEPEQLLGILTELTQHHEANQPKPWQVKDAPAEFTHTLLNHIVGIRLNIVRWQGKWKVSQNQPAENRQSVVEGLLNNPTQMHTQMAHLVKSKNGGD
ncbi:FMN-binding negative transcriptional regulator [Limnobacter humi]|uniref:FMN-binding negative transcriptional regulator n=1 Tax=Limnobacter humi TaxID=1778671 RepID=A0ABT1WG44_9BURK|nr:FMN-binding negative transcriptional regulator [Limnobacter humi]MCQ8896488.1 FMN-binding negative transcriptional regulator [Limnobacter humi]